MLERRRAELYAVATAILRDRDAAMDAVQETFVVALTHLDGIRDPEAVGRWLQIVLRNCCLIQIRRRRNEILSDELEARASESEPEQIIDEHALRNWIWTALDVLAEEERTALVLRHFTRCRTYEAIAATTGVPVGTVRSRLNRARRRLVEALIADTGPQRDQADLERSRRREWESFYGELHATPEPRTYRDLFFGDVTVRHGNTSWRGIDAWSAEEREAIEVGVRARLSGLAASRDLTVLEIDFQNPRWAADHCPPSTTFVHHLRGGRSARVEIHYHA